MEVLGYHITQNEIVVSDGEVCNRPEVFLEFLLQPKPDTIRMLYSVDEGVPCVLNTLHLTDAERTCLCSTTKLRISLYWYLVDKEATRDMFKVVGLHKEDKEKNRAYILGVKENGPCLYEIHPDYIVKENTPWEAAIA